MASLGVEARLGLFYCAGAWGPGPKRGFWSISGQESDALSIWKCIAHLRIAMVQIHNLMLLSAVACANVGTSPLGSGSSSLNGSDAAATSGSSTGIACTATNTSAGSLCLGTTACPNVLVDSTQFPNCGFRTFDPDFDLECVCFGNYLCPMGVVSTCQQVTALFTSTTSADICNQVSLGYCTQVASSTSTGTGTSSTCNWTCYAGCVNAPACIVACGC